MYISTYVQTAKYLYKLTKMDFESSKCLPRRKMHQDTPAPTTPRRSGTATVGNGARILFFFLCADPYKGHSGLSPFTVAAIVDLGRNREEIGNRGQWHRHWAAFSGGLFWTWLGNTYDDDDDDDDAAV
ncbi:uncharacterized protein TrAFT101_001825 [Trichoderma asperellum]|uniref:uncharacterized protein n=1 Tax=Trichoderma asperellum TaxID=101201 RepID=UPI00331C2879|nr:hypothetical protein TrAFT101_001825 [Trichoderma asperellum]